MYTIKEAAAEVGESEHTIRYYCKEGLFPFLTRDQNNVRKFSKADLEGVRIVLCLRDTGMPLSEIRHYMELCAEGASTLTIPARTVGYRPLRIRTRSSLWKERWQCLMIRCIKS